MIKIGSTTIDTNVILAPLSGCSDLPFRLICREHGARFCFYEMVDAHSIIYNRPTSFRMLKKHPDDAPIAAQLLGRDPSIMLDAAQRLVELTHPAFLDINSACPAKKVIKKKAGAHLLREPATLEVLVRKLSSNLDIPVTVKLRVGFDSADIPHITDLVKRCEDAGAAALFVHGRTRTQGYAGDVDYAAIRAIKEAVGIPVIGSGNVFSPELAGKMLDLTLCDGVLVGRGSFGNPWIFRDIENYLKDGAIAPPKDTSYRKEILKAHISCMLAHKELRPQIMTGLAKKLAIWYLTGFPKSKQIRSAISKARDYAGLLKVIDEA